MSPGRRCSRTACGRRAIATLTYDYSDQTAVLGPLATYAEPHGYDLCAPHAQRLSAPRGWDVLRLAEPDPALPGSDLEALADAVREDAGTPASTPIANAASDPATSGPRAGSGSRVRLRVLPPPN
ncbi:MAG TPA: DUF3499 domain-containing protein [Nocardioidaceae bacterium]|nr:DUF3499 domain-containing protein [Nocardioidaceae bacterium]